MPADYSAVELCYSVDQRRLATSLEISLGKLNYCLKALLDKGLVKAEDFVESNNKRDYLYKLTPTGLSEKAAVTLRFLRHKMNEYEKLKNEITTLQSEATSLYSQQSEQSVKSPGRFRSDAPEYHPPTVGNCG